MFLALWMDFMKAVEASQAFAICFYATLGWIASIPMRVMSKMVESIPANWLDRDTSPLIVMVFGFMMVFLFGKYIPGINETALGAVVLQGGSTSLVHRKALDPVGKKVLAAINKKNGVTNGSH